LAHAEKQQSPTNINHRPNIDHRQIKQAMMLTPTSNDAYSNQPRPSTVFAIQMHLTVAF
jgi:hypothetical protein